MAHIKVGLRQYIKKIAKEHNYDSHDITIKPVSSGGANYTSILFTVTVKDEKKEDLHLFAKVAMMGEKFRTAEFEDIFKIERYVYTELSKIYSDLEKENNVPEEHRLHFAKYYGFDSSTFEEKLILENLIPQGYGDFNRFQSMDWEYASSAIEDLAKLHALSFAYSKKYPEEFEKACGTVLKVDMPEGILDTMMQNSINTALKKVKPEYRKPLEKCLENYKKNILPNVYAPVRSSVIVHGDYRGNNLVHRVREDGKVEIKILDLQTMQRGCPVSDLLYFIVTGTDEEFRAKYYDKMIEHYYTQLSAALKRLNLDPDEVYSRKDFEYELEQKLPLGLAVAVFLLPIVTVPTSEAPKVNEDLDLTTLSIDKPSDFYTERINGIVNDFVKWGVIKL